MESEEIKQTWKGDRPEAFLMAHNGMLIAVDLSDFDRLSRYKWKAVLKGNVYYATRLVDKWDGPREYVHIDIMGHHPGMDVDHIDGNGLDNRFINLRVTSHRNNIRNVRSSKRQKMGHLKGTSLSAKGKWVATIGAGSIYSGTGKKGKSYQRSKTLYLGTFPTEKEAGLAYDVAARKYFGEFAACNFPEIVNV